MFWVKKRNSLIEAVNLACNRIVLDHQEISETSLLMHEHQITRTLKNKNIDRDVLGIAQ